MEEVDGGGGCVYEDEEMGEREVMWDGVVKEWGKGIDGVGDVGFWGREEIGDGMIEREDGGIICV